MNKLKLNDIIEAVQCQAEDGFSCIDTQTKTVCLITEEAMDYVESGGDYPEWMEDMVQEAKSYLGAKDEGRYVLLPEKYDIDEYRMMESFAMSFKDKNQREKLLIAIQGKGAFGRFKNTVEYLGVSDSWYRYRDEQYEAYIKDWIDYADIKLE
jgi:hypothetical protein